MGIMTNVAGISPATYAGSFTHQSNGRELSRLITAAVVNKGFCQMLLRNPKMALDHGFKGETFAFETEEQDFILSIKASDLVEFANQLTNRRVDWDKKKVNNCN